MMKRIVILAALCGLMKLILAALPDAAVSLVSAAWRDAHTNELLRVDEKCERNTLSIDDPEFKDDLRL